MGASSDLLRLIFETGKILVSMRNSSDSNLNEAIEQFRKLCGTVSGSTGLPIANASEITTAYRLFCILIPENAREHSENAWEDFRNGTVGGTVYFPPLYEI